MAVRSAGQCAADPGALADLHRAIHEGKTDPVRVLQGCLDRIDAVEDRVQGFRLVDRDGAMAQANMLRAEMAAGRSRGPLHGIPVGVKDVIDVAGWPTRAGSRTRENIAPSNCDASVVALLRAAGATVVGKAHTTEFAYFDGPPPTRNPHDLTRTPGGSSCGPAAVVAAGAVPLSLGTQTAGSINRPAAYCGVAAFKPSTLSWPAFGVVPFAPSFDTVGVFGYRAADATAAARVLMPAIMRGPAAVIPAHPRIGMVDDPILELASAAVGRSAQSAAARLTVSGARVQAWRTTIPFADIIAWHKTVTEFELARAHGDLAHAPEGDVTPALLEVIARGRATGHDACHHALRALDVARTQFWTAAAEFDALIFPAAPDIAPVGMKTGDPRFIIPFTALGGPMVSIPVGFDQGLPLGLMLLGRPGSDWALADLADRLASLIELPR